MRMVTIYLPIVESFDLHYEFKCAFHELGYRMWDDIPSPEVKAIMSFFSGMKIYKPSDVSKGLSIILPNTVVMFGDDNDEGRTDTSFGRVFVDVVAVLTFYLELCDSHPYGKFDENREDSTEDGQWAPYEANGNAIRNMRQKVIANHLGGSGGDSAKALAQPITLDKFPSDSNDWINWELSTIAKFQSAGIIKVLSDPHFVANNPKIDSIAAGLLKASFADKTSFLDTAFLAEDGDLIGSGYKIWNCLKGFYEYPGLIRHTLRDYQTRFEALEHKPNGNFMDFSKKFMSLRNIIIHLQGKATAAKMDDVTYITAWKGMFLNKIANDINASATAALLRKDNGKDLWECICDINAHLAGLAEGKAGKKQSSKAEKGNHDQDDAKPKEGERDPGPKPGPTLIQQLYMMRDKSKDDDKKKAIQSLIDDVKESKDGKKRPNQGKFGGKGGSNKNPKRRRRGTGDKTKASIEDTGIENEDDRSMTGVEARSIFG